jgi:serine/threonine protein kinase
VARSLRPHSLVRFEDLELDLRAGELRNSGGETVRLTEQPLQILILLLENPGEVVLREEIRNRLWPNDTIVEFEHSINAAMKRLRQALGESAENPRYIETLSRRGYRWKVPVQWVEAKRDNAGPAEPEANAPSLTTGEGNLIGRRVSHYRVLAVLGGGGMGVVYKAEDLKLGRRVALKFLPEELASDPGALQRFESEARSASALNHPNICTIYGVEEYEGQPFLVMELLEGQTLRDLIVTMAPGNPSLELTKLLDLAGQITAGLEAAHRQGIIHRDIKPANIFLTNQGQAKILDFGLAKLSLTEPAATGPPTTDLPGDGSPYEPKHETESLTASSPFLSRTGVAMGTAGYMSPEQVRGEKLDARTDLFSFGLVLYEMATGRQAFCGNTAAELHEAILKGTQSPARELNPALPPKLEKIIGRALEKDREARYQSASEMRAGLESLKREVEPRRRPWWRTMAAAGVVVLFIATTAFWFSKRQRRAPAAMPEIKLRQLTSNSSENGVTGGAISPDGKYLAYTDRVGMHLKLIETGETRTIPQPAGLMSNWENFSEIVSWFPDGTRFLAGSHPVGLNVGNWTSQGSSIWTVSVFGGPPQKLRDEAVAYSISPDGSLISFGKNPGRVGDREIWVMRSDGEQARKVFDTGENSAIGGLWWSPDGQRVIYARSEGSLDEFDFVNGDLTGGPTTRILPPVDSKTIPTFIWLPDGRLIYGRNESEEPGRKMPTCNLWQIHMDARLSKFIGKPQRLTNFAELCAYPMNATSDSKQLAVGEWRAHSGVFLADLQARATRITTPTRLTLEESWNNPFGWTVDSKAVLFFSNSGRGGGPFMGLFKQSLDQDIAEPLVTVKSGGFLEARACLSPEGSWVLYTVSPERGATPASYKLMRVPITGGSPQLVLTASIDGWPRCAKSPATLCAIAERSADRKQLVFTAFDPVNGRGRRLTEFNTDETADYLWDLSPDGTRIDYLWDLSPDGTRIAIVKNRDGQIHILSLNGGAPQEITAKGWNILTSVNWSADGKGLFVSSFKDQGAVLLHIDLQGNARILWEHPGGPETYAVPSPDGRHLAMRGWTVDSNLWMLENF